MPATATLDINHPASRVTKTKEPTDLYTKYEVVRAFMISGLTDGSSNESATALARSLKAQGVPQMGSAAPGEPGLNGAVAIDFSTQAIPGSDDSVYLLITYRNATPGSPIAFMVSDDTVLTVESTQLHPNNKVPMVFAYQAPKVSSNPSPPSGKAIIIVADTAAPKEGFQASFKYSRPLRKVVLSGYVVNKDLTAVQNAVGNVNKGPWLGKPEGYWRLDEFREDGVLGGQIIKVTVGLITRVNENWMQWETLRAPEIGRRITANQKDVDTLKKLGYFYGFSTIQGIMVAGLYPLVSFKALFGIG